MELNDRHFVQPTKAPKLLDRVRDLIMDDLMSRRSWLTESDEKRAVVFIPGRFRD